MSIFIERNDATATESIDAKNLKKTKEIQYHGHAIQQDRR